MFHTLLTFIMNVFMIFFTLVLLRVKLLEGPTLSSMASAYEISCPSRLAGGGWGVSWWTSALHRRRRKVRSLLNRFRKSNSLVDSNIFTEVQRIYKREIEQAKRSGWKKYCAGVCTGIARLHRILARNPMARLGRVKLPDGKFTLTEKSNLNHLIEIHFPGFPEVKTVVAGTVRPHARE